jgi:hypothetical protein
MGVQAFRESLRAHTKNLALLCHMSQIRLPMSSLPSNALQASRAALASALAENPPPSNESASDATENSEELNEVQEIDMQAQADGIRTVFNDPTNFNVKVVVKLATKSTLF